MSDRKALTAKAEMHLEKVFFCGVLGQGGGEVSWEDSHCTASSCLLVF